MIDLDKMSYDLYRQILLLIKSHGTQIVLGRDMQKCNEFIIIRHDVEFSPESYHWLKQNRVCALIIFSR